MAERFTGPGVWNAEVEYIVYAPVGVEIVPTEFGRTTPLKIRRQTISVGEL